MDPVAILKGGVSGLIFFLSLWSYRLITREQARSGSARKGILNTIYVFLSANLLFAFLVAASGFLQSRSEETANEEAAKILNAAETKNTRYRELMSELATTIDQKAVYELLHEQGKLATLKPSINALIDTLDKARGEGLIDPKK